MAGTRPLRSAAILAQENYGTVASSSYQPLRSARKELYLTLEPNESLQRKTPYTCGDIVRAKAHLRPVDGDSSATYSHIQVRFKCEVTTSFGHSSSSRNNENVYIKVCLFSYRSTLLGATKATVNQHHSWDVRFDFPWLVQPHSSQFGFIPASYFQHEPGHSLPPTNIRKVSVRYILQLQARRHGRMFDDTEVDELELQFIPPLRVLVDLPEPVMGDQRAIYFQSRDFDGANDTDSKSLRQWGKAFRTAYNPPQARFLARIAAPRSCCAGDELLMTLHFGYEREKSTTTAEPDVRLIAATVRIRTLVRVRRPGTTADKFADQRFETIANQKFEERPLVYDGMDLNTLMPMKVPSSIPPSCSTFNLNLSYQLDVGLAFESAGARRDASFTPSAMTIFPRRTIPPAPPVLMRSEEIHSPTSASMPEDGAPPPYSARSSTAVEVYANSEVEAGQSRLLSSQEVVQEMRQPHNYQLHDI